MKTTPATIRIIFSALVMALKYFPSFSRLNAIMNAKNITGKPVPTEKKMGNASPSDAVSVIGISIAKNKAPL